MQDVKLQSFNYVSESNMTKRTKISMNVIVKEERPCIGDVTGVEQSYGVLLCFGFFFLNYYNGCGIVLGCFICHQLWLLVDDRK